MSWTPQNVLDAAGPQASSIVSLHWFLAITCTIVWALVILALVLAIRRRRPLEDLAPEVPESESAKTRVVTGATIVTVLILFAFFLASLWTGKALATPPPRNTLIVDVIGHQWWWEVQYPDKIPSQMATTANEIHIPTGRPVMFRFRTADVIHSFWVPNLNGKRDLIPGRVTTMTVEAQNPGTYRGQCAEYCGMQHAHMGLLVIAEPEQQFGAWLDMQRKPSVAPGAPAEKRGLEVFLNSPCVLCHSIRGTDAGASVGPDLTHLASRQTLAAATIPNSLGHLGGWITDSQSIKPGNAMPPVQIAPEDLQPLLQYLKTLR